MKIQCGNVEPDGRMLITNKDKNTILVVGTSAIDSLADAIKAHCDGDEGDGCPFEINLSSGKVKPL